VLPDALEREKQLTATGWQVADGNVNMVWVVLKSAEQEVMEWATKEESKGHCANDVGM